MWSDRATAGPPRRPAGGCRWSGYRRSARSWNPDRPEAPCPLRRGSELSVAPGVPPATLTWPRSWLAGRRACRPAGQNQRQGSRLPASSSSASIRCSTTRCTRTRQTTEGYQSRQECHAILLPPSNDAGGHGDAERDQGDADAQHDDAIEATLETAPETRGLVTRAGRAAATSTPPITIVAVRGSKLVTSGASIANEEA